MESDSDGQDYEEVAVGTEERSLCFRDKTYTGNLQVSHTGVTVILN